MSEVARRGRIVFEALAPCPIFGEADTRTGIDGAMERSALLFSRLCVRLPSKQVFITRNMMGL